MATDATLTLRFVSDREFVAELESDLLSTPTVTAEVERRPVTDPGTLGFDMRDLDTLLATVHYLSIIGPLVPLLLKVIRRKPPRRILIESPFGTAVFDPPPDMSEADLKARLERLVNVVG